MKTEQKYEYGEIVSLLLRFGTVSEKQVKHAERIRQKLATPTSLVNVLKDLGFISDELVRKAMMDTRMSIRIGDLLVELGHLSEDDLVAAFNIQKEREKDLKLGEILIKYNFIDEKIFNRILSIQLGFPLIDVTVSLVDKALLNKVPIKTIIEYQFVPIKTSDSAILVAFADPLDQKSIEVANHFLGGKVSPAIAEKKSLSDTIKLLSSLATGKTVNVDAKTVVGIVNALIIAAIKEECSDIHIEPQSDRLQVRFREDGVLCHHKDFSVDLIPTLTSRIKIMCGADIAEKRRHQGGRIFFEYDEGTIDIRVSFYVTIYGEKIVFRLLKQKRELLDIHITVLAAAEPKRRSRIRVPSNWCPTR